MYCKFCGNSLDDDSIFCSNCGKKILLNNIDNLNEGKVYKDINLQGSVNIEHKSIESESKKLIKRSQYFVPIPEGYEIKNKLDLSRIAGGLGLYSGTAEKISREIEIIMLMGYSAK